MSNAPIDQIVSVLRESFRNLVERDEVELALAPGGGELEVIADEWTLTVWAPSGTVSAFLSLDEEPEQPEQLAAARRAAMSEAAMAALVEADARLEGAIAAALRRSGDALSEDLAGMIGA